MEASQHIEPANTDCGQGAAIVLLHGFPFNRTMWREQIEFLSVHNFRVLAPDLRGLGENKSDDEVATMEDMARDIAVLMDRLKIDRATICGLSMGCYVAFEFVHLFPARVRAPILRFLSIAEHGQDLSTGYLCSDVENPIDPCLNKLYK